MIDNNEKIMKENWNLNYKINQMQLGNSLWYREYQAINSTI